MSYVHCHNCKWEQDDFWSLKGYNPFRLFLTCDIPTWIRPRMTGVDPYMMPANRLAYRLGLASVKLVPWVQPESGPMSVDANGMDLTESVVLIRKYAMHSWLILGRQFVNKVRRLFTQKWWTYESWNQACERGEDVCPKCSEPLCVD